MLMWGHQFDSAAITHEHTAAQRSGGYNNATHLIETTRLLWKAEVKGNGQVKAWLIMFFQFLQQNPVAVGKKDKKKENFNMNHQLFKKLFTQK